MFLNPNPGFRCWPKGDKITMRDERVNSDRQDLQMGKSQQRDTRAIVAFGWVLGLGLARQ